MICKTEKGTATLRPVPVREVTVSSRVREKRRFTMTGSLTRIEDGVTGVRQSVDVNVFCVTR